MVDPLGDPVVVHRVRGPVLAPGPQTLDALGQSDPRCAGRRPLPGWHPPREVLLGPLAPDQNLQGAALAGSLPGEVTTPMMSDRSRSKIRSNAVSAAPPRGPSEAASTRPKTITIPCPIIAVAPRWPLDATGPSLSYTNSRLETWGTLTETWIDMRRSDF